MTANAKLLPAKEEQGYSLLDAGGALSHAVIAQSRAQFAAVGALHIANTGIADRDAMQEALPAFGFGATEQFSAGGRTASDWQAKWAVHGLRNLDYYPPNLYLLPNGEIHYQRDFPSRILFFCNTPPATGGRTFLHSAKKIERAIAGSGAEGRALLEKITAHGVMIETGFLDEGHPLKKQNYHQSWQERFGTADKAAALAAAQSRTREYDSCWWQEQDGSPVLMTRITLPGFFRDIRDGEHYLRLPRIAADGPVAKNGYRRFPLGNGAEMTGKEKNLLRAAYEATREGFTWQHGDIVLMDNIRYGHSREPFTGPREVLLGMAGLLRIEKN